MRKTMLTVTVVTLLIGGAMAQQATPQNSSAGPQTARQALMEMFFSKTPGTLAKHLPTATQAALEKSGALDKFQQYSAMMNQWQANGQTVQTFETGSLLLTTEDPKTGQKTEVRVENDSLNGDQDDIELSFQIYKNGQAQRMPFMPQMTCSMKMEEHVWRLNEIIITMHLPLADPDLLKAVTENAQPKVTANATFTPQSPAGSSVGSEKLVTTALKSIVAAETTYASRYPALGYTCTLSDLDGFGGGEPNEHQAMLIHAGLASGRRYGYVFSLSGCGPSPAQSFLLMAAPNANSFGQKTFCSNQSGAIKSSSGGNAAACLASGTPVE
jgi:hypothetical protein